MVEPYVPIEGLKVADEHAPYVLDNTYIPINPYIIDHVSFDECLEVIHKNALKVEVRIAHLGIEIL